MNPAVLLELAKRWELDGNPPIIERGGPEHEAERAAAKVRRETLRECADTLRTLVDILGSKA